MRTIMAIPSPLEFKVAPEAVQLRYIMCRSCDAPVTRFDIDHPFDVRNALNKHKHEHGHGGDNYYPFPKIPEGVLLISFLDAGEDIAVNVFGNLPTIPSK